MPARPSELPEHLGESFSCREALDLGVTRDRLRARDLAAPFRGTRLARPIADPVGSRAHVIRLAKAYAAVMPSEAVFCGRTAAVLMGGPIRHGTALEVGVFAPHRAPRAAGVAGHQMVPSLISAGSFMGLPCASPASTWAMLAESLSTDDLVRLGDHLVVIPRDERARLRPERRLATPDQLRAAALAPRRRSRGRLLDALELIRVGAMSPLETDFRLLTTRAGLPHPTLQLEVRAVNGRLIGVADAAYERYGVLVEVEGDHHRTDRRQWARDIEKHAAYVALGWEVIRLTSAHIRARVPAAPALVRAVLTRRGWAPLT
ncbi:hypothetical protein [Microbacterium sp. bgisy189]|uniref:hypothetical protein n=1 Tax=Microbacterium sp. bgisy189 TaxID=3413798 RepID=UPI003EBEB27D